MRANPVPARVLLAAAAALWTAALPRCEPREAQPCPAPLELAARDGHTTAIDCAGREAAGPPPRGPAQLLLGLAIDPNRADAATLEVLPGVGPVRARAILEERQRQRFQCSDDLLRVRGIGPITLARIASQLAPGSADAGPGSAGREAVACRGPGREEPAGEPID